MEENIDLNRLKVVPYHESNDDKVLMSLFFREKES